MAVDLRSENNYPIVKVVSITNTVCLEVQLPSSSRNVKIACNTEDIFFTSVGTDGVILGADKALIKVNEYFSQKLARGNNRIDSIFLQSSAAPATVTLIFDEE